jgi:hypothetical protein
MKKQTMGFLGILAGVAAAVVALATLPTIENTAFAQTASVGTFADPNIAAATGAASSTGPSGSAAGVIAICPPFVVIRGSCSASGP